MLTLQECIDYCDLSPEEIDAIAEHEHLSTIVAAEYGHYLINSPEGVPRIKRIILDDIEAAERRGDAYKVLALKAVLKTFIDQHPVGA